MTELNTKANPTILQGIIISFPIRAIFAIGGILVEAISLPEYEGLSSLIPIYIACGVPLILFLILSVFFIKNPRFGTVNSLNWKIILGFLSGWILANSLASIMINRLASIKNEVGIVGPFLFDIAVYAVLLIVYSIIVQRI